VEFFPADLEILESLEVVYKEFEGWQTPTTAAKSYVSPTLVHLCVFYCMCDFANKFEQYDLPKQARTYIEFIEKFLEVPIGWIGTGPDREDMVIRTKAAGLKD
jgi:adenylosuccinate synthase